MIARITPAAVRAIIDAAEFSDPRDTDYLTSLLLQRQQAILARYLARLSPIADVHRDPDERICAVDLARLRAVFPAERFHYDAVARAGGRMISLAVTTEPDGVVCMAVPHGATGGTADDAPDRRVTIRLRNGIAGPLEIHAYDLGVRGFAIVGLTRPSP
jgi:hypothetical protein